MFKVPTDGIDKVLPRDAVKIEKTTIFTFTISSSDVGTAPKSRVVLN